MFGVSRRMRPSWPGKAVSSAPRYLLPVKGHLWVGRLHYSADPSTDCRYPWKTRASGHSLELPCPPTLLLCSASCKFGLLLMQLLGFQLHLWVCIPKPLCAPASHLMGTDLSQVSVTRGNHCFSGRCSASEMREGQNLPPSSPGGWEWMAGSSHLY